MFKRLSQEEFEKRVFDINPNITILGKYINAKSRVLCECTIDHYQWTPIASSLLSGYGCPKCSGNNKKTHEEFVDQLSKINESIIPLTTYIGQKHKMTFQCKIDGHVWDAIPANILSGHTGCPICGRKKLSELKLKSHEKFIQDLDAYNKKHGTAWATDDIYTGNKSKMNFYCLNDGNKIEAQPSNLMSGYYRCHECDNKNYHNKLIKHIYENNLPIKVIGNYTGSSNKIECECTICHNHYFSTPNGIIVSNHICRDCANKLRGESYRIPINEFLDRLKRNNPDVEYIDGYSKIVENATFKCKKCGHVWKAQALSVSTYGKGCPKCNLSKGEKRIEKFLLEKSIPHVMQQTFDGLVGIGNTKIRYDFYLPTYNILIEYQGIQHERPVNFGGHDDVIVKERFKTQREHDLRKLKYAERHNIGLLYIWYFQFDDIENILHKVLFEGEMDLAFKYKETMSTVMNVVGYFDKETMTINVDGIDKDLKTLLAPFHALEVTFTIKKKIEQELDEPTEYEDSDEE